MKKLLLFLLFISSLIKAQVGIGTTTPTQTLQIEAANPIGGIYDTTAYGASTGDAKLILGKKEAGNLQPMATIVAKPTLPNSSDNGNLELQTRRAGVLTTKITITDLGNVGIGTTTPAPGSVLDLASGGNKGLVIPRVANDAAIIDPVEGMIIYDTTLKSLKSYSGVKNIDGTWSLVNPADPSLVGLNPNYPKIALGRTNVVGYGDCTISPLAGGVKYNGATIADQSEVTFASLDEGAATVDANGTISVGADASKKNAIIAVSYNGFSQIISFPIYDKVIDITFGAPSYTLNLNSTRKGVTHVNLQLYGAGSAGRKSTTSVGGGGGAYVEARIDLSSIRTSQPNSSIIGIPGAGGVGSEIGGGTTTARIVNNDTNIDSHRITAGGGAVGVGGTGAYVTGGSNSNLVINNSGANNNLGNGGNAGVGGPFGGVGGGGGRGNIGGGCLNGGFNGGSGTNYGGGGGGYVITSPCASGGIPGNGAQGIVRVFFECAQP